MDQHDVRRIRQDRSLEDIPRMYDRIGQGPDTADVQIDHLHMAGKIHDHKDFPVQVPKLSDDQVDCLFRIRHRLR